MACRSSNRRPRNDRTEGVGRLVAHRGVKRNRIILVVVTRVVHQFDWLHAGGDAGRDGIVFRHGPRSVAGVLPLHEEDDEDEEGEHEDSGHHGNSDERVGAARVAGRLGLGVRRRPRRGHGIVPRDEGKTVARTLCGEEKKYLKFSHNLPLLFSKTRS